MTEALIAAAKALCAAQQEMSAPKKDTANPFFKSKYADLGAVMEACMPALHKHGFAVVHVGGRDEAGEYVECVFQHSAGHAFSSRMYLHPVKPDMQSIGSAITYARRYTLQALAGLTAEDDDGNAASRKPEPRAADAAPSPVARADVDALKARLAACETVEELDHVAKAAAADFARMSAPWQAEIKAAKQARAQALELGLAEVA